MLAKVVRQGQIIFLNLEELLNKAMTREQNILYYHGALPNFFLWMLLLSGLLLFAYYMPTLEGAYQSVEYITTRIPFGDMIRGIHRYAADGMIFTVALHAIRVYFTDRYRTYRIIAWYSGIGLSIMMMIIGITGYILVWDERSYIIVLKITSWLKSMPIIGPSMAHAFVNGDVISNYTLSMSLFLHYGISLALLVVLWIHYMRISRPVVNVTWALGALLTGIVLFSAGYFPATSGPEADTTIIPTYFAMDWFYLWFFPLMDSLGNLGTWAFVIGGTVFFVLLPNFIGTKEREPAAVNLDKCVGCKLCSVDCPYEAIYMTPRNDESRYKELAIVIDDRCAECGLCVGACNFDAIELPYNTSPDIMKEISFATKDMDGVAA